MVSFGPSTEIDPQGAWALNLAAFGASGDAAAAALHELGAEPGQHVRGALIAEPSEGRPRAVLDGWACQVRSGAGGRQQLVGLILPGDTLGSFWRRPEFSLYDVRALTRVRTASVAALLAMGQDGRPLHPAALDAARRAEDFTRQLLVEHIFRLGARDAYVGLTHLLLELYVRLRRVGLAKDDAFSLPVGQRVLARVMGLSLAHTNMTLQRMTADGLYATDGSVVRLLEIARMERVSGFALQAHEPQALSVAGPSPAATAVQK